MYIFFFNLASPVCDFNWYLSGRVSALHSVVTGSVSSGGDHGINCRWDLIRLKQLSCVSVCRSQVFDGFPAHGNSIHNIIPLLIKNVRLFSEIWDLLQSTIIKSSSWKKTSFFYKGSQYRKTQRLHLWGVNLTHHNNHGWSQWPCVAVLTLVCFREFFCS